MRKGFVPPAEKRAKEPEGTFGFLSLFLAGERGFSFCAFVLKQVYKQTR